MGEISKNFCMREAGNISLQNVGVSRKMWQTSQVCYWESLSSLQRKILVTTLSSACKNPIAQNLSLLHIKNIALQDYPIRLCNAPVFDVG